MAIIPQAVLRLATISMFVSGLAFSPALYALPTDSSEPPQTATDQYPPDAPAKMSSSPTKMSSSPKSHADHSPKTMAEHVEYRIKTLHNKLAITDAQEQKWGDVAQAMRDNEATISQLIQERQQSPQNMTAVEDLQSYAKIAQAHVDGLQKLIPAFQTLYNDMSDDQKAKADAAFGHFEGHEHHAHGMKK